MKKIAMSLLTIAMVATMAIGATGAYFTDAKAGVISGTIGTVKVDTSGGSGGNGLDFSFINMMPGVPQAITANFQNTGTGPEDIWLVFPNATALSRLNSLGTYGEVHISTNSRGEIYANANLNDFVNNGTSGLPNKILLAQNVGPTAGGSVTFSFNYASKMTATEPGGVFNLYPLPLSGAQDGRNAAGYDQKYVNGNDGAGSGLPYQIVATQVGQPPTVPTP